MGLIYIDEIAEEIRFGNPLFWGSIIIEFKFKNTYVWRNIKSIKREKTMNNRLLQIK